MQTIPQDLESNVALTQKRQKRARKMVQPYNFFRVLSAT